MADHWTYVKYDEDLNEQFCPANDCDGSITGHIVMGVRFWFDENPEERKRLGWIKHIHHDPREVVEYNPQTQNIVTMIKVIDEYTIEDDYRVMDKSEEQMLLEELLENMNIYIPTGKVILDAHGGVIV